MICSFTNTPKTANKRTRFHSCAFSLKNESACKPGSVVDSHSSRTCVTTGLQQPTRIQRAGTSPRIPIWSCSKWGLPCRGMLPPRGALLPHPFTLTGKPFSRRTCLGGLLSAALSVGSRPPGVTWHFALWSPDFPPPSLKRDKAATVQRTLRRILRCFTARLNS